ncbi:hypothetical protein ALC57_12292 [Trachymyrmex cornetzi]|uniref:Uncharacterized protein n=1 Tax=Trachymyrmex cornetzi TaxID=471704 RepID=A0A151J160_9HYME|nr:hypothetical protein ALC57_12292 [Trachymyrmex cornetzi]
MPCEIIRCTVEDLSEKYPFTGICGTANGILVLCETWFTLLYLVTYGLYTPGIKTARFNPLQLASSSIRRAGAHFSPSSKRQKPLVTILMVTSASLVIPAVGGTG